MLMDEEVNRERMEVILKATWDRRQGPV